jgi:hypothetical protein
MSQSLITMLNNSLTNYDDTDKDWYQFVDDHKQFLLNNSILRNITPSYLQGVQYNLRAYLRSIHYNVSCTWIVQLINNLPNDVGFLSSNVSFLYVPNFPVIEALYTTYITTKNNS